MHNRNRLDWRLALGCTMVQGFWLWPLHRCGIQLFDEGTQLRFAQQAIGSLSESRLPHGFPGFDLLYALWFRGFPLTMESLRFEVFLLMTLGLGVFVLLARLLLTRMETLSITLIYLVWQLPFGLFAYYSREANAAVLLATLFLALWIVREAKSFIVASAVTMAWAVLFKFNVGLIGACAVLLFLCFEPEKKRCLALWVAGFSLTLLAGVFGSHLLQRNTDLFGVMWRMPVSYAKTLYTPIPWTYALILLTAVLPLRKWIQERGKQNLPERRLVFFLLLSLPFSLLQDFPRHWIAHFLWVPLPFWILAALSHRHLWPKSKLRIGTGCGLCILLVFFGLWVFRPWRMILDSTETLGIERAEKIRVSPAQARVIRDLVKEVKIHSKVDQPILVFPAQPLLYFLCDRANATAYDNFHGGKRWEKQAMAQLQANPPAVVVAIPGEGVWNLQGREEAPQLLHWIESHYHMAKSIEVPGYYPFQLFLPNAD